MPALVVEAQARKLEQCQVWVLQRQQDNEKHFVEQGTKIAQLEALVVEGGNAGQKAQEAVSDG
jgi:hypothetical protein